jgi:signal transduction histidine kinase
VEGQVWVFAGTRSLSSPAAGPELDREARLLATGPPRTADVDEAFRLASAAVMNGNRRIGTVVAGVSLTPYERTEREALLASLALSAVLLAVVMAASAWVLRAALRPVARMTADAAAWSERDLDRRFDVGEPHDELTRLARTLDGLLDRIAASLRHERRFSAELSHELRTPLTKITAEAELALRRERDPASYREALAAILRNAGQLTRTVDTLVAAARQEASSERGLSDAREALERTAEGLASLAVEDGVTLEIAAPAGPLRVGLDRDVVERILQPVIENACRYGHTRVDIGAARADGQVVITVRDDGPGVHESERDLIFEPGVRGSAGQDEAAAGAGLGLALSRRLARAGGGEVAVAENGPGATFEVRLPRA